MSSFDELTDQITLQLLGFVEDQEQLTTVATDFSGTDVSFTVTDVTQVSSGLIEVGDELMWCSRVDVDANIVYVAIRGMYGSARIGHASTDLVRNSPKFPRIAIKRAVNDTIQSVYPDLFGVNSYTFTFNPAVITYLLPDDVELVLDVTYQAIGPSQQWPKLNRYEIKTNNFLDKTIDLFQSPGPGRSVNVFYRTAPSALSLLTDENFTSSGLTDSAEQCIVYGACARLVGYMETSRMSNISAEAKLLDQSQGAGVATAAARYFYQMHLQSRSEEARRLLDRYPSRPHFTR